MTYAEAMHRFGSDKPDLRVKLEFTELTDVMRDVDFKVFSGPATTPGGRVAALRVPGGGEMSRGEIDAYTEFVKIYGAKGLAWIKVNDAGKGRDGLQSPIVKNLHDAAIADILARTGAQTATSCSSAPTRPRWSTTPRRAAPEGRPQRVRPHPAACSRTAGRRCGWSTSRCSSTTRRPQRWNAVHHPFTAPKDGHEDLMDTDPGACVAKAYDMVLNGWELGGGSVRIHRAEVQAKVFKALNISPEEPARQVRLPARRAAVRRAAARRPGLRPGPPGHADDQGRERSATSSPSPRPSARSACSPVRPAGRRGSAAARAAHPAAQRLARQPQQPCPRPDGPGADGSGLPMVGGDGHRPGPSPQPQCDGGPHRCGPCAPAGIGTAACFTGCGWAWHRGTDRCVRPGLDGRLVVGRVASDGSGVGLAERGGQPGGAAVPAPASQHGRTVAGLGRRTAPHRPAGGLALAGGGLAVRLSSRS
jgi:hypothetical protein